MKHNTENKSTISPGCKTRMIKQRETHVIWALDFVDKCIKLNKEDTPDRKAIDDQLKKLRKEICKI